MHRNKRIRVKTYRPNIVTAINQYKESLIIVQLKSISISVPNMKHEMWTLALISGIMRSIAAVERKTQECVLEARWELEYRSPTQRLDNVDTSVKKPATVKL